jgi:TctA family transporter
MLVTVVFGFVVADGALAVISPSLLLASYARKVGHGLAGGLRLPFDLILRVAGALLIAAALYAAHVLEGSGWPVGQIAVFAAFGLACQIFDWNRLVLLLALSLGPLLEENIRRVLLITYGQLTIYLTRPITLAALTVAFAIVMVAIMLSAWSALGARRPASG